MLGNDPASALLVAALDGERLSSAEQSFFEKEKPAGVTLFRRNISSSFLETQSLCADIRRILDSSSCPPVIAIDQEGGRVSRIPAPFPNIGPAKEIGTASNSDSDLQLLKNYGFTVASSLLGMGINVNFAPVCDVITNEVNHAIGDRAFSDQARIAADRAEAFLHGMQGAGVKGCLKHFPGQGDAGDDTHQSGTVISHPMEILEARELLPFRQLIPSCPMVMISHAVFTGIDQKPASLSTKVMVDLLQEQMGFSGVVVTDDMNMKAIPQDDQSWADAICDAVSEGADMVLVCQGLERCQLALDAMRKKAASSPAFSTRLEQAALKMMSLRKTLK